MSAVWRKAWADLCARYWQSVLILLAVGGAGTLLYLGLASLTAASSPYEKQMARASAAHAWFHLTDDEAGRTAASRIAGQPEVADSLERPTVRSVLVDPSTDKVPWVDLLPSATTTPSMMGYILIEGRDITPQDDWSGLLEVSMARYLHVTPGDSVQFQTPDGLRELQVVGLIADPKSCTFPRCQPQSLYVTPGTFAQLSAAGGERRLLLGVRLHEPETADMFVSRMRAAETKHLRSASSWQTMQDFYQQDRVFSVLPVLLFSIVAVIAAAMILATIIGGTVLSQYKEIAMLKALGFSGTQVLFLYVGQTLLLSLTGGVLGVAVGHFLAIRSMAPLARSMGTPDVLRFMPDVALGVVLTLLPVAAAFAALAAWRAVALRPAAMLADGFAAPRSRTPLSVRLLAAARLPVPLLLGVKDATARPGRTALTLSSLAACLVTLTLSLNFPNIGEQIWQNRDLIGINWDMTVEPGILSFAETEASVKTLPGLEGYYREKFGFATAVDQQFDLPVRAVDGDWHRFGFRLLDGQLPEQPGEVLLAARAWDRLQASVGSQLTLQVGERRQPVTVVGKYQDQINNGRMLLMRFDTLAQLGAGDEWRPLLRVKLQREADWQAARRSLLERTNYQPLVFLEDTEMPDFARDVVGMMGLLAWVMGGIAGLSVTGAALLTAREQMREAGIRKAIGMSPGQVVSSVAASGAYFGLAAVVLALPTAWVLQKGLAAAMAGIMGLDGMPLELPSSSLFLAAAVGMLIAIAASLPAAAWAARIPVARVLQSE